MPPRKKPSKAVKPVFPSDIDDFLSKMTDGQKASFYKNVMNGLGGALGYPGQGGYGLPGSINSSALSQIGTLEYNLRWYFLSLYRQVLSEMYVELSLVQAICDLPVQDALRGGIKIKSKQLDEDQIREVQTTMEREDDLGVLAQAAIWMRLYGGGGILINNGDDPVEPLRMDSIKEGDPLAFKAADLWELLTGLQNDVINDNKSLYDPQPQISDYDYFNYYALQVHKSRVMVVMGKQAPSFLRPRLRGWGLSECETLVRSINQYLKATDLSFEVLDEFKIDVYRMKNLINSVMSPQGEQAVTQRIAIANWNKNYQNALVLDSEDEYVQKQLSFAGLAEIMAGIRMQIAADMRMPICKLFGSQAGGLNPDEDADLEVYNNMVEGSVRSRVRFHYVRMVELRCQQAFGFIPDDVAIDFKPLRELKETDQETVKTQKFTRLYQALDKGAITTFEFREACNKGNLLEIELDNAGDSLNPDDPEVDALTEGLETEEPEEEVKE